MVLIFVKPVHAEVTRAICHARLHSLRSQLRPQLLPAMNTYDISVYGTIAVCECIIHAQIIHAQILDLNINMYVHISVH